MRGSRARRIVAAAATAVALAVPAAVAGSSTAASAASSNDLTVKATEYTFKVSGDPQPGNVKLTFDNVGVEHHMLGVVPLKKGVTTKQLMKALMSQSEKDEEKLGTGSEPIQAGFVGPGQSMTTIVDLSAGHYGMFCFIPAPDGEPHVAHGMVQTFDVSGSKSSYKPPTDGVADVKVSDTGFTLPSSGVPKAGWVKLTNTSGNDRDVTLVQLNGSAAVPEAKAYFDAFFESGKVPTGTPPASINGAYNVKAGGASYFETSLKPGRYVLVTSQSDVDNDPNEQYTEFTVS